MAQQTHKIIVIGYTNLDEDHFYNGRIESRVGGGGYFSAQSASKELGKENVLFVSHIGQDFDEQHLQQLNTRGIARSKTHNTSKSVQKYLDPKNPANRELTLFEGTSQLLSPEHLRPFLPTSATWVHISTMPPLQQAAFIEIVRTMDPETTISIDSDICLYNDEHLPNIKKNFLQADVVFANRSEYALIGDIAQKLPFLIVKEDEDGAKILTLGKVVAQQAAPKVTVKNSTGAGDTFAGAYITKWLRSKNVETSLDHAVQVASTFISQK